MKKVAILAFIAVMLTGIALAGDNGNGCKLQGTWTSGGPYDWWLMTITFEGTGDNNGTYVEEVINDLGAWLNPPPELWFFNPMHPVTIPNAHYTVRRGNWVKTGPKTYKAKSQGYVVQKIEIPEFPGFKYDSVALVFLDNLTITLKDFNTAEFEVETPYFFPGETDSFYTWSTIEGEPGIMKRLLMSQEYPFPE